MKVVALYRVSTQKQGSSGLSLEAQRESIRRRAELDSSEIIAEYTEVESGKTGNRPKLTEALDLCRTTGAVLMIASLDRLARSVSFLFSLKESGVKFIALDMPELNTTTLGFAATFGQAQREYISEKTKVALETKRQICGEWRTGRRTDGSIVLSGAIREKGLAAIKEKAAANINNRQSRAYLSKLKETGELDSMSLKEVAKALNSIGFRTARGRLFTPQYVHKLKAAV